MNIINKSTTSTRSGRSLLGRFLRNASLLTTFIVASSFNNDRRGATAAPEVPLGVRAGETKAPSVTGGLTATKKQRQDFARQAWALYVSPDKKPDPRLQQVADTFQSAEGLIAGIETLNGGELPGVGELIGNVPAEQTARLQKDRQKALAKLQKDLQPARVQTGYAEEGHATVTGVSGIPSKQFVSPIGIPFSVYPNIKDKNSIGAKRRGHKHEGVDLLYPRGTQLYAASRMQMVRQTRGKNKVITFECLDENGNPDGYTLRYIHADLLKGNNKNKVWEAGEPVTVVGAGDNGCVPHLHFEVLYNGVLLDPEKIFDNNGHSDGSCVHPYAINGKNKNLGNIRVAKRKAVYENQPSATAQLIGASLSEKIAACKTIEDFEALSGTLRGDDLIGYTLAKDELQKRVSPSKNTRSENTLAVRMARLEKDRARLTKKIEAMTLHGPSSDVRIAVSQELPDAKKIARDSGNKNSSGAEERARTEALRRRNVASVLEINGPGMFLDGPPPPPERVETRQGMQWHTAAELAVKVAAEQAKIAAETTARERASITQLNGVYWTQNSTLMTPVAVVQVDSADVAAEAKKPVVYVYTYNDAHTAFRKDAPNITGGDDPQVAPVIQANAKTRNAIDRMLYRT